MDDVESSLNADCQWAEKAGNELGLRLVVLPLPTGTFMPVTKGQHIVQYREFVITTGFEHVVLVPICLFVGR